MTQVFNIPFFTATDNNGVPISGAKLFIYEAGTTTKLTTYSDSALSVANSNPLVADSAGRFGGIFGGADDYKFVLAPADDTDPPTSAIKTTDNYTIAAASSFSGGINAAGYTEHLTNAQTGTTYTFLTGDRAKRVTFSNSAAQAVTLPQANSSTFPDGWYVTAINKGAGIVTITPTTSTIGGLTAIKLTRGQSATIYSDGTNYDYTIKGEEVGNVKYGYSSTPPVGYLLENGNTIGSAGSGATKAGAIYEAIYQYYWNNISDTYAPVSTGRGASAAADFAANKTLTIPDNDNRVPYGAGTQTTGATHGAASVTPTGSITINSVTLSQANLPNVNFNITASGGTGVAVSDFGTGASVLGSDISTPGNNTKNTVVVSSGGSGTSFTPTGTTTINSTAIEQRARVIYWYIKY